MNALGGGQPGQPGQPGHPGHPGQPATPQMAANLQRMPPMYRPEQMRSISLLNDEEKQKYERGLAQLWTVHENAASGSQERSDAKRKIQDFGKMLQNKMQSRKQHLQQQQQLMMQAQGSTPDTSMAAQAGADGLVDAASGASSNATAVNAVPATNPANGGANNTQQLRQIPANVAQYVDSLVINVPPSVPDKAKYVADTKANYTRALMSLESAKANIKRLDDMLRERQAKGNPLRAEEQAVFNQRKTALQRQHNEMLGYLTNMRKEVVQQQQQQQQPPPHQHAGQPNQGGPPQQPGNAPGGQLGDGGAGPSNTMHSSAAAVNAAFTAARNQQAAAGHLPNANAGPGQQLPGHAQNSHASPALASPGLHQQQQQHQQQSMPTLQQQQQPPQVKMEPGSHSQVPPQINTAIAQNNGLSASGTPTQNRVSTPQTTPTSAVPPSIVPPNQPRPLTHAVANNLANTRNGLVLGGTPSSAGVMGAPQNYSHAHPQTSGQTVTTAKLISKALPESATRVPMPVPSMTGIPSARPTYSGGSGIAGGVMAQPAMPKIPTYSLDGEGERVLSKKKLDELVRQVCGGTGEGQEGNMLAPEVEESVLNLADSFVDNVLHASCRLAKERGSKTLEIRDIQMVLERVYNIRIPGYSSDELRTVRKMPPGPAWITKMSAVQAAKEGEVPPAAKKARVRKPRTKKSAQAAEISGGDGERDGKTGDGHRASVTIQDGGHDDLFGDDASAVGGTAPTVVGHGSSSVDAHGNGNGITTNGITTNGNGNGITTNGNGITTNGIGAVYLGTPGLDAFGQSPAANARSMYHWHGEMDLS